MMVLEDSELSYREKMALKSWAGIGVMVVIVVLSVSIAIGVDNFQDHLREKKFINIALVTPRCQEHLLKLKDIENSSNFHSLYEDVYNNHKDCLSPPMKINTPKETK